MHLTARGQKRWLICAVLTATLLHCDPSLAAKSPFGVGVPEPTPAAVGGFGGFFLWVAAKQSAFYQELTASLKAMTENGSAFWTLVSISFLYGIFHAAGPGHGKAVISTYVLANRETARRGIVLAVISSMIQATVAVVLVTIAAAILGATSQAMTDAARVFEVGSYALITLLGAWLLWTKAIRPAVATVRPASGTPVLATAGGHHHHHHHHEHNHHHDHEHGESCGCGHAHVPDANLAQSVSGFRSAAAAVLSVGIRPCSGALIVLVFALSQGLFAAGVASTFAMGIGTALTVSALVVIAVTAKDLAINLAGRESSLGRGIYRFVEIGGAAFIFLVGVTLLMASTSVTFT